MWSPVGSHVQCDLFYGHLWDFMYSGTCLMWSPVGSHVQCDLFYGHLWDFMYSGTCLMWSPVGPHVQWDLSNMVTCGTSFPTGLNTIWPYYSIKVEIIICISMTDTRIFWS